jgi:CRP-like cAMP-binding protein
VTAVLEPVEIGWIEQIRSLRSLFGLQHVATPALAAVAAHAVPVRIPAGTQLAVEGQPVTDVYVVIEGELATRREGRKLGTFGPHSAVGALASFARDARGYECTATRDTVALALQAEELLEVFEDHFDVMHAALRAIAHESIDTRLGITPHAGFSGALRPAPEVPVRPLDLVERLFCLREVFPVGVARLDAVAEIARTAREVRYPAGTRLWSAGDRSSRALNLLCGEVACSTSAGLTFRFGPLDILGSLDLIAGVPRWFDAIVERDVVGLALDVEVIIDLWEDHPDLCLEFLQLLASTLLSLRETLYSTPGRKPDDAS